MEKKIIVIVSIILAVFISFVYIIFFSGIYLQIVSPSSSAIDLCIIQGNKIVCNIEWETAGQENIYIDSIKINDVNRLIEKVNSLYADQINTCRFSGSVVPANLFSCGCGVGKGLGCRCEGFFQGSKDGSVSDDSCVIDINHMYKEGRGLLGQAVKVEGTLSFLYEKKCPPLPESSDWTDCIDRKQHRNTYKCGIETNFDINQVVEERNCEECKYDKDCLDIYNECFECIAGGCERIKFDIVNCGIGNIFVHYDFPACHDTCMQNSEFLCRKTSGTWRFSSCDCGNPRIFSYNNEFGCIKVSTFNCPNNMVNIYNSEKDIYYCVNPIFSKIDHSLFIVIIIVTASLIFGLYFIIKGVNK